MFAPRLSATILGPSARTKCAPFHILRYCPLLVASSRVPKPAYKVYKIKVSDTAVSRRERVSLPPWTAAGTMLCSAETLIHQALFRAPAKVF